MNCVRVLLLAFVIASYRAAAQNIEGCANYQRVCRTVQLRKECQFTRWDCQDFGYIVHNDVDYLEITGKCNERGPRYFCSSEKKAEECKATQEICRKLGYWNF